MRKKWTAFTVWGSWIWRKQAKPFIPQPPASPVSLTRRRSPPVLNDTAAGAQFPSPCTAPRHADHPPQLHTKTTKQTTTRSPPFPAPHWDPPHCSLSLLFTAHALLYSLISVTSTPNWHPLSWNPSWRERVLGRWPSPSRGSGSPPCGRRGCLRDRDSRPSRGGGPPISLSCQESRSRCRFLVSSFSVFLVCACFVLSPAYDLLISTLMMQRLFWSSIVRFCSILSSVHFSFSLAFAAVLLRSWSHLSGSFLIMKFHMYIVFAVSPWFRSHLIGVLRISIFVVVTTFYARMRRSVDIGSNSTRTANLCF